MIIRDKNLLSLVGLPGNMARKWGSWLAPVSLDGRSRLRCPVGRNFAGPGGREVHRAARQHRCAGTKRGLQAPPLRPGTYSDSSPRYQAPGVLSKAVTAPHAWGNVERRNQRLPFDRLFTDDHIDFAGGRRTLQGRLSSVGRPGLAPRAKLKGRMARTVRTAVFSE
jgi:hypothetical protein